MRCCQHRCDCQWRRGCPLGDGRGLWLLRPHLPDIDEVARILACGHNVVSSYFINARSWGPEVRDRLEKAAIDGKVSLFGSGIFPGFANFVAAIMASASTNFRKVRFLESTDLAVYEAIANFANCGWGEPPDEKWKETNEAVLGTYSECVDVMADMLGIPITSVDFDYEWAITPDDREYNNFKMPAGTIAGQRCQWTGKVGDKSAIELQVVWNAGPGLEPEWPVHHGYTMEVEGDPNISTRVKFSPSETQIKEGRAEDLANAVTAMPVVSAIPAVCEAAPGIRTYADLPLIKPRYVWSDHD